MIENNSSLQIEDHFPFDTIRPAQKRALEAIMKAEQLNKKYILLELPTGVGKSGIAWAMGSWCRAMKDPGIQPGGYILTTQKTLQAQYLRDFESMGLVEVKGANNYWCQEWETDCSSGGKLSKAVTGESCGYACPYKRAKSIFMSNQLGVTNFSYFLNDNRYVKSLTKRQSVIVDEAHNAEKEILSFADIEISKGRAETLGLDLPFFEQGQVKEAFDWLESRFLPAGAIEEKRLEAEMKMAALEDNRDQAISISRKHDALDKYLCKVRRINGTNLEDWFVYSDETTGSLYVKPLTAAMFSDELLFNSGKRILMMSATILDKKTFARNLGIDMSQAGFLRLESDFPVENRLIHFYPTGKMSMAHQENTIPKMLKTLEKILNKHNNEKGIIHCQSYKIQKIVSEYFSNTAHASRLLTHTAADRVETIIKHTMTEDPTILLSPSMTEGLDLKEDLSRFQVIIKLPFPFLGDKFIKARMERDPSWYTWQTSLTLVQATGRSIRSQEDYATTYILDSDFMFFLSKANSILPKWWLDSIVYHT